MDKKYPEKKYYKQFEEEIKLLKITLKLPADITSQESFLIEIGKKLINTTPLKNLEKRYQLGLIHKVAETYSGATHSRLEHSIGVMAKCIVVTNYINSISHDLKFSNEDMLEILIASALHDSGHLPISHATERAFIDFGKYQIGIKHEERIIPLLLEDDDRTFKEVREIVKNNSECQIKFHTLLRIACLIDPKVGAHYVRDVHKIQDFEWPKKASIQLISSELDMDRLDYIIRDSEKLNYTPVILLKDDILNYIKGLSLKQMNVLDTDRPFGKVELCLNKSQLKNAFYLLISRVLLYKFIYFSEKVRRFEATLTYLIGKLLLGKAPIDTIELLDLSDDDFITNYIENLVVEYTNEIEKRELEELVKGLKYSIVARFKILLTVKSDDITNPRFKAEFEEKITSRKYIENIKDIIANQISQRLNSFKGEYLLFDPFTLDTGRGDFLVEDENNKLETLRKYMNGSNMHRLCSERRLDIYIKTELGENTENGAKEQIINFFTS